MLVQHYMTKNPITVSPDTNHPQAVAVLRKNKIRHLPVVEDDQLVGVIVEKDLLSNQPSPATTLSVFEMYSLLESLRVRQMMSHPVITVGLDCPVEEAAHIMVEHKISCLPIMNGEHLVGIITETDIFKVLVNALGGYEAGMRITLRLQEKVGQLAILSTHIADTGGNIVATVTSHLQPDGTREITIKEQGANSQELERRIRDSGLEILDLRPSGRYQPRLFG